MALLMNAEEMVRETITVSPISHRDVVIVFASDQGDASLGLDRNQAVVERLITVAVGDQVRISVNPASGLIGKKLVLDVCGEVIHERSESCKKKREHIPHPSHHELDKNVSVGAEIRAVIVLSHPDGTTGAVKEREVTPGTPLEWTVPFPTVLTVRFDIDPESVVFQTRSFQYPSENNFLEQNLNKLRATPQYHLQSHTESVQPGNVASVKVEIQVERRR